MNSSVENVGAKRAVVIFDTRYGNTEKIARWFESGLQSTGIETMCADTKEVNVESLKGYDLICVGAPTEWHTSSKPMKEFLKKLESVDISGKYGFAFDTKLDRMFSGSAANFIEKRMKHLGLKIIEAGKSATVFLEEGRVGDAWLKEGEEKRFEQIGRQVGADLLARAKSIQV